MNAKPSRRRVRRLPRAGRAIAACAAAVLVAAPMARAMPLLSEVFYDASGADDAQLFVEIHAAPGSVLDGLTVEGVNGAGGAVGPVITLAGSVGASGLFVVADADASGATQVAVFDQLANFDFQNGPDSVVLRDGAGILDALGYGSFGAGDVFAGEGVAAPDAPAGSSLARVFADVDSGDNASDFAIGAPTPGTASFATPVPEPGSAVLLGFGLLGLGLAGRRR